MICSRCGTLASDQAERCPSCGRRLKQAILPGSSEGVVDVPTAVASGVVKYAGFWRRFLAFWIDGIIISGISFITALLALLFEMGGAGGTSEDFGLYFLNILIIWLYYALMESSRLQATLGKMALGIIVTDYQGNRISFARATGRRFASILSGLMFGSGYLMIVYTGRKQGLHDVIAKCLVVRKRSYAAGTLTAAQGTAGVKLEEKSPLSERKPGEIVCAKCGTANIPEARFCRNCGAGLTGLTQG